MQDITQELIAALEGDTAPLEKIVTEVVDAPKAYAGLTPKGRKLMAEIGDWHGSFFDDGIVENSGIWGSQLNDELGMPKKSFSGVMNALAKAGLWGHSEGDPGDDSDWWYLTALGAAVAKYAASLPIHGKPQGEATQEEVRSAAAGQAKAASKKVAATKATASKKAAEVAAADDFVTEAAKAITAELDKPLPLTKAVKDAIAKGAPVITTTGRYAVAKAIAAKGKKRGPGRKVTDEEVVAFIAAIRATDPGITRNQAEQVSYWVEKFAVGVDRFNRLWDSAQ